MRINIHEIVNVSELAKMAICMADCNRPDAPKIIIHTKTKITKPFTEIITKKWMTKLTNQNKMKDIIYI